MKLLFVDETSDDKFKDYFGLCVALLDSTKYSIVRKKFDKIIKKSGWNKEIEFKGNYIFSAKKGDQSVSVEKRIQMATEMLDLTSSKELSRFKFGYFSCRASDHKEAYNKFLPLVIKKLLPKAPSGPGKDLISVYCDYRSDVTRDVLNDGIIPILAEKGYTVIESLHNINSNMQTIGILYTDIVAYLMARVEATKNDAELFESIPPEMLDQNGKIRKMKTSQELIRHIQAIDVYKPK